MALLDHHNTYIIMFSEYRLHLKGSIYSKLSIKRWMEQIEWMVKENTHFEN